MEQGKCLRHKDRKRAKMKKGIYLDYFVAFTLYLLPSLPLGVSYCARCAKYIVFISPEKYSKHHF